MTEPSNAQFTKGLRKIADLVERLPDGALPASRTINVFFSGIDDLLRTAGAIDDAHLPGVGRPEAIVLPSYFVLRYGFGPMSLDLCIDKP